MLKLFVNLLLGVLVFPVIAADNTTLPSSSFDSDDKTTDCTQNLQQFDELLEESGFGTLNSESHVLHLPIDYDNPTGTPRMRIERLRDSAYYFAQRGDPDNCHLMVSAMKEIYNDHQGLVGLEVDDLRTVRFWRKTHLSRTRPLSSMEHFLRAELFIGAELRNRQDELLGTIRDIIVDPSSQNIRYVLIANGGFLGFGQNHSVARWNDIYSTTDHELFMLDVSKDRFSQAPTLDARSVAPLEDGQWQGQLERFWDSALEQ